MTTLATEILKQQQKRAAEQLHAHEEERASALKWHEEQKAEREAQQKIALAQQLNEQRIANEPTDAAIAECHAVNAEPCPLSLQRSLVQEGLLVARNRKASAAFLARKHEAPELCLRLRLGRGEVRPASWPHRYFPGDEGTPEQLAPPEKVVLPLVAVLQRDGMTFPMALTLTGAPRDQLLSVAMMLAEEGGARVLPVPATDEQRHQLAAVRRTRKKTEATTNDARAAIFSLQGAGVADPRRKQLNERLHMASLADQRAQAAVVAVERALEDSGVELSELADVGTETEPPSLVDRIGRAVGRLVQSAPDGAPEPPRAA